MSRGRKRARIQRVFQSQLVAGFSIAAGTSSKAHSVTTWALKRARQLPSRTAATSAGRSPSSPWTWLSVRNAGGPPGWFRARLKLLHGVPSHTAATHPALIQPNSSCWLLRSVRSYFSPKSTSHTKVGRCRCIARVNFPVPAKSSMTTAIVRL